LVVALGLAIGLRVARGTHVQLGLGQGEEGFPEVGREARIAVADERARNSVVGENVVEEQISDTFSGDVGRGGDRNHHLGQAINEHDNGVVSARGLGQSTDEVEADGLPRV
jgi:hypothetical protein